VGDERLLWLYISSSPSQEEKMDERSREGRGGLYESTCFFKRDARNWDSGGIADVPGLSVLQTQDTCTHTQTQV